jgi:hypothetical protein
LSWGLIIDDGEIKGGMRYLRLKIFCGGESGVALILLALAAVALIGLAALALNLSYRNNIVSEVRAAAEAAAHAGASQVCPRHECWNKARVAAIEVLNRASVPTGLGSRAKFNLDASVDGHSWEVDDVRVTVERGLYGPGMGFRSFEDPFAQEHPGVPVHAASNAISVGIEVRSVPTFMSLFGKVSYGVTQRATASARSLQPTTVAPFALSVCSLMDSSGNLQTDTICKGDRFFTSVWGACPPDGGSSACSYRPGVQYAPAAWGHVATAREKCFWSEAPVYSDLRDYFGVVGLANVESVEESMIRDDLTGSVPFLASVGDRFRVLDQGLEDSATDAAVWNAISNVDFSGGDHMRLADSQLPEILPLGQVYYNRGNVDLGEWWACYHSRFEDDGSPDGWSDGVQGMCNSHRLYWGKAHMPSPSTLTQCVLGPPVGIPPQDVAVWQIKIPVIADFARAAPPCAGVNQAVSDPAVNPGGENYVIGFVDVIIFDSDIGADPPPLEGPDWCGDQNPFPGFPWGYQYRCNMVRARVLCGTNFLAATTNIGWNVPTLVP